MHLLSLCHRAFWVLLALTLPLSGACVHVPLADPPPEWRSPDGYREARWGMPMTEVQQLFPTASPAGTDSLVMTDALMGHDTSLVFHFVRDRLVAVTLAITPNANAPSDYAVYTSLCNALDAKYGKRVYDHITRMAWDEKSTTISIAIQSVRHGPSITVAYWSRELRHMWRHRKRDVPGL